MRASATPREKLSAARVRRSMHAVHAVTSLVLVATGLLITFPDLRALAVGGYGREIARLHLWVGVLFAAAPVAALLLVGSRLARDAFQRLDPTAGRSWRKLHIVASTLLTVVLALSGIIVWLEPPVGMRALDVTLEIHEIVGWVLAASIPLHLLAARRKLIGHVRLLLRLDHPDGADPLVSEGDGSD